MKRGSFQIKALNRGLCFLATDNFLLKISAVVIRHTNRGIRSRTFLLVVTHKNFSTLLVRPFLLKWYPNSPSSLPSEQQTKSPDVFTSGSLFVVPRGGLEPPCLAALPPQGSKSTSFSTWAYLSPKNSWAHFREPLHLTLT